MIPALLFAFIVKHICFSLQVVYFVNSGSEANDLALMMARAHTKAYDIINLRYKWH